jgi:hypothetical protein
MAGVLSDRVFERIPHLEDELAYLYQARIFAGGQIVIDSPENFAAFWQPFVIDFEPSGKRFGKYPPGWPALLAFGELLGHAWLVNAILGALTVIMVFQIGREIWGPPVGLVAAILTAFSPATLLLNATLMAHTSSLFFATLFLWCSWRFDQGPDRIRWAVGAGLALGSLFTTRPLSAVAIALPIVVWMGVRIVSCQPTVTTEGRTARVRASAAVLVAGALVASALPLFNYAATGHPTANLYRLVWDYDRLGFGEGHGRTGHSLENGMRHARYDLSLASADLFGWQPRPITPNLVEHLQSGRTSWPVGAFSFVMLPIGVLAGLTTGQRQRNDFGLILRLLGVWSVGTAFWVGTALRPAWFLLPPELFQGPGYSWIWIVVAVLWINLPLVALGRWWKSPAVPWTWIFLAAALSLLVLNMTYWTGSMRYSTRYYFEVLTAVSLLSAVPVIYATTRRSRLIVVGAAVALSAVCLVHYSIPRISALHRFNGVGRHLIEKVNALGDGDRPILVLVTGDTGGRWQPYGALMAVTGPYLEGDVIAARARSAEHAAELANHHPDHQIIELHVEGTNLVSINVLRFR